MPALRFSFPRPLLTGLVTVLLALHAWLAVSATIDLGVTGDETVHLTGGYSYWRFNDYRLHPENGNLPQRWAALPLLALAPHLDPSLWPRDWEQSDAWMAGQHFFFDSGNPIDYLLLWARSAMVVWSVATGLLVFFWSRALWGKWPAVWSLTLYAFSPTVLAHAALVTSDMCAAFWILASVGAWWRLLERFSPTRLAISTVTFSLALLSKYSALTLLPVFALLVVWTFLRPTPTCPGSPRPRFTNPWFTIAATHAAIAIFVIWAAFGFRYSAFSSAVAAPSDFFSSFDAMLPSNALSRWLLIQARSFQVLPEAFVQGLCYVLYAARERASFAAGEYGSHGWPWFFPFAFLVKSSVAELLTLACLMISGLLGIARNHVFGGRRCLPGLVPLLGLAAVYGAFSISSHLNIGQRHILPLYPVLFILGGALIASPTNRLVPRNSDAVGVGDSAERPGRRAPVRGRSEPQHPVPNSEAISELPRWPYSRVGAVGCSLIVGLALFESFAIRPHYLAFFNQLAGGPSSGRHLLGDSSLDWGQNLPQLAQWLSVRARAGEPVYLSYFGADDALYRGIRATELAPYFSFGREREWAALEPGLYCIGASMLQDAASPFRGAWTALHEGTYQQLRSRLLPQFNAGTRTPRITHDEQVDTELWTLERAQFARLCLYLRVRRPEAQIGHSLFIYRLSTQEIRTVTNGSMSQLADLLESTIMSDGISAVDSR